MSYVRKQATTPDGKPFDFDEIFKVIDGKEVRVAYAGRKPGCRIIVIRHDLVENHELPKMQELFQDERSVVLDRGLGESREDTESGLDEFD